MIKKLLCSTCKGLLSLIKNFDFLGPVAIRIYLIPIFWMAGIEKITHIESTAEWFGNPEWGLGLPYPVVLAYLSSITEFVGAILLAFGLGVRFITVPLMIIMIVAAVTVHWENGWLAIASQNSEAHTRLQDLLQWLKQNYPNRHDFVTQLGSPVILNNGVEFSITYFVMLLSLFFTGAGKYLSVDYWIARRWQCD